MGRRQDLRKGAAADPALDFAALGELVGLGVRGPLGLLIHTAYGPWWAMRRWVLSI